MKQAMEHGRATIDPHAVSDAPRGIGAVRAFPPAGFVDRAGAAAVFGISSTQLYAWLREGRLAVAGTLVNGPNGARGRVWAVADLEAARAAMANPVGFVASDEAMALFDVGPHAWVQMVRAGVVPAGRDGHGPGGKRCKLFSLDELKKIKAALDGRYEPQADPDRAGVVRVRVRSDKHAGLVALLDAADAALVAGRRLNWTTGSKRDAGVGSVVLCGVGDASAIQLARAVAGVTDPALVVTHVNGDRLDYRRANLVARTRAEVKRLARRPAKWDAVGEPYADPDRPGVVRVPICTEKHAGMEALIDAGDLPLVAGKRWNWSPGKADGGSVVLRMNGTPKPSLARTILGVDDAGQLVSHRNGNRLDCRRENLVVRTRGQVRRGARKTPAINGVACDSRFKGVTRTESGRKWQSTITVGGAYRNLGRFRSEVDAALAYDAAGRELFGEHAHQNLPDPAEAQRLRALEPIIEDVATWPPVGMVDRHDASAMFGVSIGAWLAWEKKGRITCGAFHPLPNDRPGRCKLYPRDALERARVEIEALGKPYADPNRAGVWRVPLKSYLAHREALIDAADLGIVEGKNWNWSERQGDGKIDGVVVLATTGRQVPLHRLIAGVTETTTRVSFANGDSLDCRRANLATRTLAETNHTNRKMGTINGREYSSRFKGVSHDAERGKWVVQIRKDDVHRQVGRFDDETAAAEAYDDCARVWFGDHAYVNFPGRASGEANRAWAQRVLDGSARNEQLRRRRRRKLERKLRRAAHEARRAAPAPQAEDAPTIGPRVARKLFGATRTLWRRWRRLGWLPAHAIVDGKRRYRLAELERLLRACGKVVLPYLDPERAGVWRVPLAGETAKGRAALIDADALPLVYARRWRFAATDTGRGGEVQTMNPAENVRLHYVVMGLVAAEGQHVGHRNDDPLDCRRENLVVRSLTDTAANKRKQATWCGRPCTSRFKGVHRDARRERWVATIKKDGKQRQLGSFHDELAAAQAYDEAARQWFGEHARPNFPDGVDAWLKDEADERRAA